MKEKIRRVGIVGAGLVGAGIAGVCARAGNDVIVVESGIDAAQAAAERLERSVSRAVAKGRADPVEAVVGRVRIVEDLAALAERKLRGEAIVEAEQAKVELYRQLDKIVEDPGAILGSNTSSIPIMNSVWSRRGRNRAWASTSSPGAEPPPRRGRHRAVPCLRGGPARQASDPQRGPGWVRR